MEIKANYKDILGVAMPLVLANLAGGVAQIVDTAFVNRIGEDALNGTVLGAMIWTFFSFILLGFSSYAQMLIARRVGAKKEKEIGSVIDHLLVLGLGLVILIVGLYFLMRNVGLPMMISDPAIIENTIAYLGVRMWSLPVAALTIFCAAFFAGIGRTVVITYCVLFFITANVFLDYGLIFGNLGFPRLEVHGAALATSIAETCGLLVYIFFLFRYALIKKYELLRFVKMNVKMAGTMALNSLPLVVQNLLGFVVSLIFFVMIEKMGAEQLRVSFLLRSVYLFLCIPIFSLGQAVNTIVSNILGQGKKEEMLSALLKSHYIGFGFSLFLCTIIFCFQHFFLSIYTSDPTEIEKAIPVLKTVLVATLIFSLSMVNLNAIIGIGDTKAVFFIGGISLTSNLLFAYYSIFVWQSPLTVVWMSEWVNWGIVFVLSSLYFVYWKAKIHMENKPDNLVETKKIITRKVPVG